MLFELLWVLVSVPGGAVYCCIIYNDFCDEAEILAPQIEGRREARSVGVQWDREKKKHFARRVTQTLDDLFSEESYNQKLRPGMGYSATSVEVNLAIRWDNTFVMLHHPEKGYH